MLEINSSKIDKELLEKEIEKNVQNYKPKPKKRLEPEIVSFYTLEDFFKHNDEAFIQNIYRTLLKREVDAPALQHYLHLLRSGLKSKGEILAIIRFSKEGKEHNVEIKGILPRYLLTQLYKIPLIGYLLKTVVTFGTMPKLLRKYNALEANFLMQTQKSEQNYAELQNNIEELRQQSGQKYKETQQSIIETAQKSEQKYKELIKQIEDSRQQNDAAFRSAEKSLKQLIQAVEESLQGEKSKIKSQVLENLKQGKEYFLDNLYIAFENKFRGSREDIQKRQSYYLPLVQEAMQDADAQLLDVGCGRGEWLDLLKNNALNAQGVDLNRAMVDISKAYGLNALHQDAIAYLKSFKEETLTVVTGFHIVEHLPFEVLIELLDEALRVLKKGGMIIFETPNPENLLVGSCTFYTDPTHINPIPPITLEFLAQNRGFTNVTIHRLHPIKEPQYLDGTNTQDVNNLIYAATKEQDYAVIGYKI